MNKQFALTAAAVVVGVFVAGTALNAFRNNELVRYARDGFDG